MIFMYDMSRGIGGRGGAVIVGIEGVRGGDVGNVIVGEIVDSIGGGLGISVKIC